MRLTGRTAVVTGAGSGIGKAIALRFAEEGARVVAIGRTKDKLLATVAAQPADSPEMTAIAADLSSMSELQSAMDEALSILGHVDVMVANAGGSGPGDLFSSTLEDWDNMLAVNTRASFFCMQAVAPSMKEQRYGRIVFISSIAAKGFRNPPLTNINVLYATSKAAITGMTRSAAMALGQFGITVNSICPGPTRSEPYLKVVEAKMAADGMTEDEVWAAFDAIITIGRSNDTRDVAHTALFLASDEARHITGQSWNVDGGLVWD